MDSWSCTYDKHSESHGIASILVAAHGTPSSILQGFDHYWLTTYWVAIATREMVITSLVRTMSRLGDLGNEEEGG